MVTAIGTNNILCYIQQAVSHYQAWWCMQFPSNIPVLAQFQTLPYAYSPLNQILPGSVLPQHSWCTPSSPSFYLTPIPWYCQYSSSKRFNPRKVVKLLPTKGSKSFCFHHLERVHEVFLLISLSPRKGFFFSFGVVIYASLKKLLIPNEFFYAYLNFPLYR